MKSLSFEKFIISTVTAFILLLSLQTPAQAATTSCIDVSYASMPIGFAAALFVTFLGAKLFPARERHL